MKFDENKEKFVITITRQFGSLGRPIAQEMSKRLGVEFYDRDIVDATAEKLDLPVSIIDQKEESAVRVIGNSFTKMRYPLGRGASDVQDRIYHAQENIIKYLVERESCIVVGRCADYILSDYPNSMHIYIYAPYAKRVENSVEELGLSLEEAKKTIREVDEARDSFHMHYAGYKPDDKHFKDIMIDSSFLGVEGTVDCLVDLIKRKFNLDIE